MSLGWLPGILDKKDMGVLMMEFTMHDNGFQSDFEYGELTISGKDEFGFRPYSLLVSSIAGCSGGVLKQVMEKMRLPFEDITITAHVKRNPEEANRLEEIKLHFTIVGEELSETKVQKAMDLTRKNCSMVQSVKDSIEIIETFEIKQPGD